jgi:hypothetical protein
MRYKKIKQNQCILYASRILGHCTVESTKIKYRKNALFIYYILNILFVLLHLYNIKYAHINDELLYFNEF